MWFKSNQYIMTRLQFKGSLNIAKGKVKQKVAFFMNDNALYTKGVDEELMGHIQMKIEKTQNELRHQFQSA